ncbi:putative L-ascorbate peroxidase 6 isoform X3 [Dioscorea cayenensis subsp. rotundata]|uniref:L-ascorbate peroxidase 6 isoform X3 n=1 Tax=Dioscorea cayennensis subsp. rotundata TaxID=55577 RepID=A0AB40B5T3_DIOCR|nr:putative L-ascorbate peroxidase 6 isoform X3 [Dioscorea cayenensis subsp. rotundata]
MAVPMRQLVIVSDFRLAQQLIDSRHDNRARNVHPHISPPSITTNGVGFSYSCQRRELLFMLAVPFIQSPQEWAQASEASDLSVIQSGVRKVLSKSKAAAILRLAFHDAGTFNLSDNSVSWADLISVAGAEAVSLCGGPAIPIKLGRLDTREPDPQGRLPEETLDASDLKRCFLRKGFSTQELVALSGAHTLGSKGFGNPNIFDNSYFKILIEKPWASSDGMSSMIGLPSDRALVEDDECSRWISIYADDEARFFNDFKNAYAKLVNSGASWRNI